MSTAGIWTAAAIGLTVVLTVTAAAASSKKTKVLHGPLTTIPVDELERNDTYRPDHFPGARDVPTPYGSMRVYEFGAEDGPKVVLIHGISTACVTLGPIAEGLVERGCRVMLFDLFGRGMSDGVADVPHDERLYVSQTLLALASSPLSWTGRDARLRVVGYSLGGGVAVHLAAALPELVSSLVLLAPAGLVDPSSFGAAFRFLVTGGVVPDAVVAAVLRKRLRKPMAASTKRAPKPTTTETMATAEAIDGGAEAAPATKGTPLERRVLTYVSWMVANHAGFMSAFISSARHAPLTDQHATFARLADRPAMSTALLMARDDELIIYDDYERDALPLVGGRDHVYWAGLPGGHDFVMTHTAEILRALDNFWGSK